MDEFYAVELDGGNPVSRFNSLAVRVGSGGSARFRRRLSAAPLLSIQPSVTNVHVGDVFVLDVSIADADDLFAFDVEVSFDPTIVQALGLLPGTFLGSSAGVDVDFFSDFIDNGAGEASGAQSRLTLPGRERRRSALQHQVPGRRRGHDRRRLRHRLRPGHRSRFLLRPPDSNAIPMAFDTASGVVNVAPSVPEPATALVVGIGLIGALSRRRARALASSP